MLARENRLRSAADFRSTMRQGRKANSDHFVVYLNNLGTSTSPRFGFVVSKAVGSAVQRNLVKRRAREVVRSMLASFQPGDDLVFRALPGAAKLTWLEFTSELDSCFVRLWEQNTVVNKVK